MEKRCFKCQAVKPIDEFYKHPAMGDGHLGKCKECTRQYAREHYRVERPSKMLYEQERSQRPERRAAAIRYQQKRRRVSPEKYHARQAVGKAIRDGRLWRQPCEVCGEPKSQAHHEDYSKPLEVRWLCFYHHRQAHGQQPLKRA